MSKILFINVGGQGHVLPTLRTVAIMVTQGHKVTYCCLESFRSVVEGTGAEFVAYESELSRPPPPGAKPGTTQLMVRLASDGLYVAAQLFDKIRVLNPDLIVYDEMAIAGRVIADALKINSAVLHSTYAANEHFSLYRDADDISIEARVRCREFCNQITALYRIPAFNSDDLLCHPAPLHIIYMPRELHPAGEHFPDSHHFVGPGFASQPKSEDRPTVEAEILVSMGTVFNRWVEGYRIIMEALGGKPWRVAMSIGKHVQRAELGLIPEQFTVAEHLPQLEILSRCLLAILHGGMGSTVEALSAGVPLIVIPQIPEQVVTGRQLQSLGLGFMIRPEELTAKALEERVYEVMTDTLLRRRLAEMRNTVGGYSGSTLAAQLLNEAAASG